MQSVMIVEDHDGTLLREEGSFKFVKYLKYPLSANEGPGHQIRAACLVQPATEGARQAICLHELGS